MSIALEPLAVKPSEAARLLSLSRRTISNLIQRRKLTARKYGVRTLIDVASIKAFHEGLPVKLDPNPLLFGQRRPRGRACPTIRKHAVSP